MLAGEGVGVPLLARDGSRGPARSPRRAPPRRGSWPCPTPAVAGAAAGDGAPLVERKIVRPVARAPRGRSGNAGMRKFVPATAPRAPAADCAGRARARILSSTTSARPSRAAEVLAHEGDRTFYHDASQRARSPSVGICRGVRRARARDGAVGFLRPQVTSGERVLTAYRHARHAPRLGRTATRRQRPWRSWSALDVEVKATSGILAQVAIGLEPRLSVRSSSLGREEGPRGAGGVVGSDRRVRSGPRRTVGSGAARPRGGTRFL